MIFGAVEIVLFNGLKCVKLSFSKDNFTNNFSTFRRKKKLSD